MISVLPGAFGTSGGEVILGGGGSGGGGSGGAPTGPAGGDLNGTYPNPGVDDGADGTAIHDDTAGEIAAIAAKAVPVGADYLLIEDSADSDNKKSITIADLPPTPPTAHASTHQNGGADEIDVTDLSGVLADNQPAIPADGLDTSALHDDTAGEIAAITAKATPVSADYLVIEDSADTDNKKSITIGDLPAAAPAAHASSHENGGSDEINVGGLSGVLADDQNAIPEDGIDTSAIHDDTAGEIAAITAKATPTSSDYLVIEDAADSDNKKSITIGDLPAPAAEDLATTLSAGNTTGGTGLEVTAGDPLVFNENASVPGGAPGAGTGKIWVKNDAPNTLYFTDDGGTDHQLGAGGGGGGTELDAAATSENLKCSRTGQSPTVDASFDGQVNLGSESAASHGTEGDYSTISGGLNGFIDGDYGVIGGGSGNDIGSQATLGAGGADYGVICGGEANKVDGTHGFVGGGRLNEIDSDFSFTVNKNSIVGGYLNEIRKDGTSTASFWSLDQNFIGGGRGNTIRTSANASIGTNPTDNNVIVGGFENEIKRQSTGSASGIDCNNNFIGAGSSNTITENGDDTIHNFIGAGDSNSIENGSVYSVIGGGSNNSIVRGSGSVIVGGQDCIVGQGGTTSNYCVVGGYKCEVTNSASYCIAAGRNAKVTHDGVLLFADSVVTDVDSVEADQAHFGVQNGVRVSHTTEEDGFVTRVDELQTSDSADNAMFTETLDDNSAMLVTARIVGMESDGSDRATYILNALVYRDGGGATLQGSVDRQLEIESDAAWDANISVTSNDVEVTVNGNGDTVEWRATIQKQRVA